MNEVPRMLIPLAIIYHGHLLCAPYQGPCGEVVEAGWEGQGRGGEGMGRMGRKLTKEIRKIVPILQGFAASVKEVRYTHIMPAVCSPKT